MSNKDSLRHNLKIPYYTRIMNWYRNSKIYLPLFNHLIRLILKIKWIKDKYIVDQQWTGKEHEVTEWYKNKNIFFGFSSIRSGTVFLANILTSETKNSHIEHEANIIDYWHYPKAIGNEKEAEKYFRNYRFKEIPTRVSAKCNIYGEVNPFLRLHCKAIKSILPDAKLFHIIRDGREVVRSVMSREILGNKDPFTKLISPPINDPYKNNWVQMTRFEKVCWQWQFENHYIRQHVSHFIMFEELISNYTYFKNQLLDYLGIDISIETWQQYVERPKNITPNYQIGHWENWSDTERDIFKKICGNEMEQYGYKL